jgi:phospholipid/cholesterol/gamma-HCH transport system substrate-binding protein
MSVTMRRVLGFTFVAILAAGIALSVLAYNKAFTPAVWVTLETNQIGLQLNRGADVKLRDVVVGRVERISSSGRGASLRLALEKGLVPFVPRNVHARLLPRTLFGERYVALVPPPDAAATAIRDGDVIGQDRSRNAIELEQVLDHSLALLQKINVDELAATLAALATAVEGKGERIGRDIVTLDAYLKALNAELPVISEDVRLLADTLTGYDGAAEDLLAFLRDVSATANTVTQQQAELNRFLVSATGLADETRLFLQANGDRLIRVGNVLAPVVDLLKTYAPEYPCLLRGIVALQERTTRAYAGGRMRITQYSLQGTGYEHQGPYRPGDSPAYRDQRGPSCAGLDQLAALPPTSDPANPAGRQDFADGYRDPGAAPRSGSGASALTPVALRDPSIGYTGTAAEAGLVKALVAAATDRPADTVADIAVLLWGPLMRGAVVNVT